MHHHNDNAPRRATDFPDTPEGLAARRAFLETAPATHAPHRAQSPVVTWAKREKDSATFFGLRRWSSLNEPPSMAAHREDFAEACEYYWLSPDTLRARSPRKFAYMRDVIFEGHVSPPAVRHDVEKTVEVAPVVERLAGASVRIPGFVVPLETDGEQIREFLLVPYFGACVHVPPPPANQLIHVIPDKPVPAGWNMLPVWVEGVMAVGRVDSEMGVAGYQLRGIKVEEYQEPLPK